MSKLRKNVYAPMLSVTPESGEGALARKAWIYELKLDGVRIVAHRQGAQVDLEYRSARPATKTYPEIARAVLDLPAMKDGDLVLDGEVVAFDEAGRPSFQLLERRIGLDGADDIAIAERHVPVIYVVFDILEVGGEDLRTRPLRERRAILETIVPDTGLVRTLHYLTDDGRPLFELCRREGLEGVIAKRFDSPYRSGVRHEDWLKIKCQTDDDFVVVGMTRGNRARDALGALDIATYEGDQLVIRGKVGSGLDERTLDALKKRLAALVINKCAAKGKMLSAPRGRTFVKPEIVVSVRYAQWSNEGVVRFPVFRGVRPDVSPRDCTAAPSTMAESTDAAIGEYYASVAQVLLPYLRGRDLFVGGAPVARVTTEGALRQIGGPLSILAPDWAAFDTDLKGAHALRRLLEEIGLAAFPRTGEGAPFQVLVPLGKGVPANAAQAFADLLRGILSLPRITAAPAGPILAPYAPAARAVARVSTPLSWDEVTKDLDLASLTRSKIADRVARIGDPMAAILTARVDFGAAVAKLEARIHARR